MYLHITSCIGYIIFPYKDGAWLTLHSASHTIVRATPSFSWTGPGDSVSNWRSGPLTVRYALPSVAMSPDGCTVSENRANVWSLDVRRPSGGLTGAEIHRLAHSVHRGGIERWSPHPYAVEPLRETHRMLRTYHELALTSV